MAAAAGVASGFAGRAAANPPLAAFEVVGDAIARPLAPGTGDVSRGRRIVIDREVGNCLICHHVPEQSERFQGDLGPDLAGVGNRLSAAQLRLRVVDQTRLNPASIMPAYYRIDGLARVAERYAGKPVLTAEQVEDVVAYLASLKE